MSDHFTMIPRRFTDAHIGDELDAIHVLIGVHVAARCYEVRNTSDGVAAIRLAALAELCEVSGETVRRKLHELRERSWVDFQAPGPGQHAAWRIWLTGLARDDDLDAGSKAAPQQLHRSSTRIPPSLWSSSSTEPLAEDAAIARGDRDRTSAAAPHDAAADSDRRDETRREKNSLSEEKLAHVVGKTTAAALRREQAFLDECQALVDAGLAGWHKTESEAR